MCSTGSSGLRQWPPRRTAICAKNARSCKRGWRGCKLTMMPRRLRSRWLTLKSIAGYGLAKKAGPYHNWMKAPAPPAAWRRRRRAFRTPARATTSSCAAIADASCAPTERAPAKPPPAPMLIADGHLDLAWNALQWNRNLLDSVYTIRATESHETGPGRALGTLAQPDLRADRNVLAFPNLLTGATGPITPTIFDDTPDQH